MPEPMTEARLTEIRDLNVDSLAGDAIHNPDVWTLDAVRRELLAEVDRLRAYADALKDDSLRLHALRTTGVDRWDGYGYATEIYRVQQAAGGGRD